MRIEIKECHQCGRKGTRQFSPWPEKDVRWEGAVYAHAGEWWECSNREACRRRRPEQRADDD